MDSYKSLVAWQMAHLVASVVLDLVDRHWTYKHRSILDQLSRAALSIEANIVEGYALGTDPYMHKHYRIAFGSAAETEVLLTHILEKRILPSAPIEEVLPSLLRAQSALRGLMAKYLPTPHAPRTTSRSRTSGK
jgi:four helix bundle protein